MLSNIKDRSNFTFLLAFSLLNIIGLMLFTAALTFSVNRPISTLNFPVSILFAFVINWLGCKYYFNNYKKAFLWLTLSSLALFAIALLIAYYFYDISWDGQQYHQEVLIQLKNGWNPFYRELSDRVDYALWVNHYGKGAEIPEAVIYIFFNKIETGKATNILLLLASFFLIVSLLLKLNIYKAHKIFLISSLLVFNPVFITQILSYYVDQQLGLLLLCLLVICAHLFIDINKYKLFLLAVIIQIALNIKFTAIPYVGVFIIGFLFVLLCTKNLLTFKRVFISSAFASVVAIVFVGFNPYMTNTIRNGNPFYPLAGKNTVDIFTTNSPYGFDKHNRFYNFFTSLFSESANIISADKTLSHLKFPFSVHISEIKALVAPDIRIGGFGFLFSGIFILSILLLYYVITTINKRERFLLLSILATIIISGFIIEYSWWARYVPQFWFLSIVILAFAEPLNSKRVKWLRTIIYTLIIINITTIGALMLVRNFLVTQKIRYSLSELAEMKENVKYVDFTDFKSTRIKFAEENLHFAVRQVTNDEPVFNIKETHTRAALKHRAPKHIEPFLIKLYYKIFPSR